MNWLKLNTDGASLGNRGKAGRGGVIRGSASRWVKGFSRSIGFATNVVAECWALRDGLWVAPNNPIGYSKYCSRARCQNYYGYIAI